MQINISVRHGHINTATQETISEKVERVLKFYDRVTAIHVTVDLKHSDKPEVELVVKAEHHDDFVARGDADTLLNAVDSVAHKMEMQLRKHKEKLKEHNGPGHKHLDVVPPDAEDDVE